MSIINGVKALKKYLENIPAAPGVYRMLDKSNDVLYVGKAKNLVKRLTSYTKPERLEYRIQSMISQICAVEVTTTKTEAEAFLLEANLIKKYEPKYNILLKDDKSYPFILITENHDFPRITKHRGKCKEKGKYYGPFVSGGAVNKSIADLQKAFLIRPCSDSFFAARKRPCIEYQIKRCSAPCVNKISQENYAELVKQTKDFLSGKSRDVQERLQKLMTASSEKYDYEKAASYRDRIKALNHIQAKQLVGISSIDEADVIGIYSENGKACVQVFFFRGGQNYGNTSLFPQYSEEFTDSEILANFLIQFYQKNQPPKEVIISHELNDSEVIAEALAEIAGYKVYISVPKAGDKKKLIELVVKNSEESLRQKLMTSLKHKNQMAEIAKLFGIDKVMRRIEVYDNSHIMGTHQVGAMIVAGEEGFNKKAYRRFDIKESVGDDYAMMREVMTRRFKRLKQECPEYAPGIWPDLVLIDGGKGQLSVVTKVIDSLGLAIKIVCISKGPDRNAGREQFHMVGKDSFTLPPDLPVMHYLQILRDEAHRFAIAGHKGKRAKSVTKSTLDKIPGIGAKRKKQLINHFGSAAAVMEATIEELMKVQGINKAVAENIISKFKA